MTLSYKPGSLDTPSFTVADDGATNVRPEPIIGSTAVSERVVERRRSTDDGRVIVLRQLTILV